MSSNRVQQETFRVAEEAATAIGDQDEARSPSHVWMRSVSFAGLHRILHAVASHPDGVRPTQLNLLITAKRIYETQSGKVPAAATLYHGRNTLLHIKALVRRGERLVVNGDDPHVETLLKRCAADNATLDDDSREAFAELVLQNPDCKRSFFDLFMTTKWRYTAQDFRSVGTPVTWNRRPGGGKPSPVELRSQDNTQVMTLRSHSAMNAVLYGLRYWARDELNLIDEFFDDKRGFLMYPIIRQPKESAVRQIEEAVRHLCNPDAEWTTLSVRDLLEQFGERKGWPVSHIFAAIRRLASVNPGHIVLIPTSRSFAALRSGFNEQRQELELRSYLRDSVGRYISHVRLHQSIRSLHDA
jgi:hypothetical protein